MRSDADSILLSTGVEKLNVDDSPFVDDTLKNYCWRGTARMLASPRNFLSFSRWTTYKFDLASHCKTIRCPDHSHNEEGSNIRFLAFLWPRLKPSEVMVVNSISNWKFFRTDSQIKILLSPFSTGMKPVTSQHKLQLQTCWQSCIRYSCEL